MYTRIFYCSLNGESISLKVNHWMFDILLNCPAIWGLVDVAQKRCRCSFIVFSFRIEIPALVPISDASHQKSQSEIERSRELHHVCLILIPITSSKM